MGEVLERHLGSSKLGGLDVLDAVALPQRGAGGHVYFFTRGTDPNQVTALFDDIRFQTGVNGAAIVWSDANITPKTVSQPEPELLSGRNVIIATRNGEPVDTIMDWLTYHHDHFGLNGVVIFDRSPAAKNAQFRRALKKAVGNWAADLCVVLVETDRPLGDKDAPPEHHPISVNEAPGRDRMEVPKADPWTSPLSEASIYEIARQRFAAEARAVANIDLHDLLYAPGIETGRKQPVDPAMNPFDCAVGVPGQIVEIRSTHCYPWRVRKHMLPRYADHICVQFDKAKSRIRWCVAPGALRDAQVFKIRRVAKTKAAQELPAFRCMAIRHPVTQSSKIVPKTSLVEDNRLLSVAKNVFQFKPVRAPKVKFDGGADADLRTAIVTTMKNEGPFILEWLAYHQAIGVQDFLIYTNDCTDGTAEMFDLLQSKGIVQHRENPFRELELKPQHAALQAAEDEKIISDADWVICMDVDEFLNIKVGDGRLKDLYAAVGDANMISCTWRLFGNSDLHRYTDDHTIGMFTRCAHEFSPKPHQAWGFKTLYRNNGIFKKMGVHRPKGLRPQIWDRINWVNGSGQPIPKSEYRNSWRSTSATYGYDLVSLNHYAVRNAESFLVKRDRGRVNHVERDQGLAYWFRMNNNATVDTSIQKRIPMMEKKLAKLMADPEIRAQHLRCVAAHTSKIAELKSKQDQMDLFNELTSPRMEQLSRMHAFFGANVFLGGPKSVPDDIVWGDHPKGFQFTVERTETQH